MKALILLISIFLSVTVLVNPLVAQTTNVATIMEERDTTTADKKKVRYCSGGVFQPCVCAKDVSKKILYRPSVRECKGNAAIILAGQYASSFSAVVRNLENADRIPAKSLINGCTIYERDVLGLNKCSVYKAQKVLRYSDERGPVTVHCLGARGTHPYFNLARRITIKLADIPGSTNDPLVRACLVGPTKDLN